MLKCTRMASVKGISGLNWCMLDGKLLYSVIVLSNYFGFGFGLTMV